MESRPISTPLPPSPWSKSKPFNSPTRVSFIPTNTHIQTPTPTESQPKMNHADISSPILWTASANPLSQKRTSPNKLFDAPKEDSEPCIKQLDEEGGQSSVLSVLKRFNPGNKAHSPSDVHYNGNLNGVTDKPYSPDAMSHTKKREIITPLVSSIPQSLSKKAPSVDEEHPIFLEHLNTLSQTIQDQIHEMKKEIQSFLRLVQDDSVKPRTQKVDHDLVTQIQQIIDQLQANLHSSTQESVESALKTIHSKLMSMDDNFESKAVSFAKREDIVKVSSSLQKANALLHEVHDKSSILQANITAFVNNSNPRACQKCAQETHLKVAVDELKSNVSLLVSRTSMSTPTPGEGHGLDRTAKNSIMSLNEKMIQLSKMTEHHQQHYSSKISALDEKVNRVCKWVNTQQASTESHSASSSPSRKKEKEDLRNLLIQTDHDALVRHNELHSSIKNLDHQLRVVQDTCFDVLSRRGLDEDSQSQDTDCGVVEKLENMKQMLSAEQEMTRDRMNQLLNMFTILQEAHLSLSNKDNASGVAPLTVLTANVERQANEGVDYKKIQSFVKEEILAATNGVSKQVENQFKSFQSLLASYLPTDLEMRIASLESQLSRFVSSQKEQERQQRTQLNAANVGSVSSLASDIISQNASVLESLDSIQHNVSRICDCLDSQGRYSVSSSSQKPFEKGEYSSLSQNSFTKQIVQEFVLAVSRDVSDMFDQIKKQKSSELRALEDKKRVLQDAIEKLEGQRERHLGRLMVEKLSCEAVGDNRSNSSSRRVSISLPQ